MTHNYHKKKRKLQFSLTIWSVVILVSIVALFFVRGQYLSSANPVSPNDALKEALQQDAVKDFNKNNVSINSGLGFGVSYDKRQFVGNAQVIHPNEDPSKVRSVMSESNEVFKTRDYAIINLYDQRIKNKDNIKRGNFSSSELSIVSTALKPKDFFDKRRATYGKQLSELDLTEKHFSPKPGSTQYTTTSVSEIGRSNIKVNGDVYRKVTYQDDIVYSKVSLKSKYIYEKYYLVKDGRPFAINVTNVNDKDQEFVASLRASISNIHYGSEQTSSQYGDRNSAVGGKVSSRVSSTNLNTPYRLKSGTAIKVVAKSQPATVRVGMAYCTTITLKLPGGQPFITLPNACNGGIGTGSIISSKGYVSTNGHVTTMKPSDVMLTAIAPVSGDLGPLKRFIEYLQATGLQAQSDAIINGIENSDPEIVSTVQNVIDSIPPSQISANEEKYQFVIQLGKKPIKVSIDGRQYSYKLAKDQIVKAEVVDRNFNIYDDISTGEFTASDVAILKITDKVSGGFPVLKLGSIDSLKKGDLITAIGYPAFVDGGTETRQKYTFPTATQGEVVDIMRDSPTSQRNIVNMTTPIGHGNSGGPAMSTQATMLGLNTYGFGSMSTGDDGEEGFSVASGFRDVADLKQLLAKNNIKIDGSSSLSNIWSSGIDDFSKANYRTAKEKFAQVKKDYPAFYLSDIFLGASNKQVAIEDKENAAKLAMIFWSIALVIGIVGVALLVWQLKKHNRTGPGPYNPTQQTSPTPAQQYNQPPASPQPPIAAPTLQYPPADAIPTEPIEQTIPSPQTPQQDITGSQQTIEVRIDHNDDKTNT